jgi:serine/threonine protein kinase
VSLSPDFVLHKRGSLWITVRRSLAEDSLLESLADPDLLFGLPGCQIIKDQRKIKVARIKLTIQGRATTVYLKRYNAFSWRYRIGSLFQSSGASRSLKGAAIATQSGVQTSHALAAVESRSWGMLTRSFFLSEEITRGKTADSYWRDVLTTCSGKNSIRRRRIFLNSLGGLFALLHRKRLYHNDLKDANIIVSAGDDEGEHLFLLDLEGIRICRHLTIRRRVKNLVQLNRTFGRSLSATQKLYVLKSYLGCDFLDYDMRRLWVQRILKATRKGNLRSLRKVRRQA